LRQQLGHFLFMPQTANDIPPSPILLTEAPIQVQLGEKPEEKIEEFINSISPDDIARYRKYWETITPKTPEAYYKRWLFAFLSVHTSWRANVRAYVNIDKEQKLTERERLMQLIVTSRVGLIKMRTEGMWRFRNDFWKDPAEYYQKPNESWSDFRDRVMNKCHGLGNAKSSFALELCYPNTCEVTCLDTHMLQLYGAKPSPVPSPKKYKELEKHWVSKCLARNYPPFMVRNIYWDKVQEQENTRYWSYVFEEQPLAHVQ
jgi:hypothetical protein